MFATSAHVCLPSRPLSSQALLAVDMFKDLKIVSTDEMSAKKGKKPNPDSTTPNPTYPETITTGVPHHSYHLQMQRFDCHNI